MVTLVPTLFTSYLNSKMTALRTVTFSSASKVVMAFKFPFWERENGFEKKGGSTKTDLAVKQIYYPQKSKQSCTKTN